MSEGTGGGSGTGIDLNTALLVVNVVMSTLSTMIQSTRFKSKCCHMCEVSMQPKDSSGEHAAGQLESKKPAAPTVGIAVESNDSAAAVSSGAAVVPVAVPVPVTVPRLSLASVAAAESRPSARTARGITVVSARGTKASEVFITAEGDHIERVGKSDKTVIIVDDPSSGSASTSGSITPTTSRSVVERPDRRRTAPKHRKHRVASFSADISKLNTATVGRHRRARSLARRSPSLTSDDESVDGETPDGIHMRRRVCEPPLKRSRK